MLHGGIHRALETNRPSATRPRVGTGATRSIGVNGVKQRYAAAGQTVATIPDCECGTCGVWPHSLDSSSYYLEQQQQQQQLYQQVVHAQPESVGTRRKRNATRWSRLRTEPKAMQVPTAAQPPKAKKRPNLLDIGGRDWSACNGRKQHDGVVTDSDSTRSLFAASSAIKARVPKPHVPIPKNIVDIGAPGWGQPDNSMAEVQQHQRSEGAVDKPDGQDNAWLKKDITTFMQDLQRLFLGRS